MKQRHKDTIADLLENPIFVFYVGGPMLLLLALVVARSCG